MRLDVVVHIHNKKAESVSYRFERKGMDGTEMQARGKCKRIRC